VILKTDVFSALTATLTAGPGVSGNEFVDTAKNVMPFGIPVWQLLCLLAASLLRCGKWR